MLPHLPAHTRHHKYQASRLLMALLVLLILLQGASGRDLQREQAAGQGS
jgi:hypothetical protein